MESYAVTWREPARPVYAGKLELENEYLRFEGAASPRRLLDQKILYRDLESVEVGRGRMLAGEARRTLVLKSRFGNPILIESIAGLGTLTEMAARIGPVSGTMTA